MTKTQTPAPRQRGQLPSWEPKKRSSQINAEWSAYNIAQIRAGKPAVMLPTNLSLEELEVKMINLLKQLTAK